MRALDAALERRAPVLWWRDDDALAPTPALDRLLSLTGEVGAPLTLAVIPEGATEALARRLEGTDVAVAVHGLAHRNHAPEGEKKAEFGAHRPLDALHADAARGRARIEALFGARALPLFVPPWNRMAEGFDPGTAVSAYGRRAPGGGRLDTHWDPVDWRGSRSWDGRSVGRLAALMDDPAPIGLLTHHLMHDEALWEGIAALVRHLTARGARWAAPRDLIAGLAPPSQLA